MVRRNRIEVSFKPVDDDRFRQAIEKKYRINPGQMMRGRPENCSKYQDLTRNVFWNLLGLVLFSLVLGAMIPEIAIKWLFLLLMLLIFSVVAWVVSSPHRKSV